MTDHPLTPEAKQAGLAGPGGLPGRGAFARTVPDLVAQISRLIAQRDEARTDATDYATQADRAMRLVEADDRLSDLRLAGPASRKGGRS